VIEGDHQSLESVMADPSSTTGTVLSFAGHAEDAVKRCNDDKAQLRKGAGK